jgi:hypothetical protein
LTHSSHPNQLKTNALNPVQGIPSLFYDSPVPFVVIIFQKHKNLVPVDWENVDDVE